MTATSRVSTGVHHVSFGFAICHIFFAKKTAYVDVNDRRAPCLTETLILILMGVEVLL